MEVSQKTLFTLLESNSKMFKVFDVNLRKPFYDIALLERLMSKSLKLGIKLGNFT